VPFRRIISFWIVVSFFLTTLVPLPKAHGSTTLTTGADSVLGLPAPGTMVNLSPAYQPVIIKGLTVHKDNPFLFDFIVDIGQDRMSGEPLKKEGEKLIKYFLASLAIPDKDVWVNLSPYEKNKIIPEALGQTDMGRDLLEEDYILKQITASLIYPEKQLGKTFWDKVYAKAQQMYGTTQIPVNTFNKVWIMADRAEVFEHNQTAFVVDSHLKVMLEEDYLALTRHSEPPIKTFGGKLREESQQNLSFPNVSVGNPDKAHSIASQIVKQIILPQLEKEVNTGKNFVNLRQIFNSIILSSWYKKNLKEALLNQVYANKSKVKGIERSGVKRPYGGDIASSSQSVIASHSSTVIPASAYGEISPIRRIGGKAGIQKNRSPIKTFGDGIDDINVIYEQYLKAYKKGVFNYIKEDINTANGETIPRKYFSGGMDPGMAVNPAMISDPASLNGLGKANLVDFATLASPKQTSSSDALLEYSQKNFFSNMVSRSNPADEAMAHNPNADTTAKAAREIARAFVESKPQFTVASFDTVKKLYKIFIRQKRNRSLFKNYGLSGTKVIEDTFIRLVYYTHLDIVSLQGTPGAQKDVYTVKLKGQGSSDGAMLSVKNIVIEIWDDVARNKSKIIPFGNDVNLIRLLAAGHIVNHSDSFDDKQVAEASQQVLIYLQLAVNNSLSVVARDIIIANPQIFGNDAVNKARDQLISSWRINIGFRYETAPILSKYSIFEDLQQDARKFLNTNGIWMIRRLSSPYYLYDLIFTLCNEDIPVPEVWKAIAINNWRGLVKLEQPYKFYAAILLDKYPKILEPAFAGMAMRSELGQTDAAMGSIRLWPNEVPAVIFMLNLNKTFSAQDLFFYAGLNVKRVDIIESLLKKLSEAGYLGKLENGKFKIFPEKENELSEMTYPSNLAGRDRAQISLPGGIDLNTAGMNWKISKDGKGVEMTVDPTLIERIRHIGIDSLTPVIFRITPVTSIWPLVGLQAPVPAEHLAGV